MKYMTVLGILLGILLVGLLVFWAADHLFSTAEFVGDGTVVATQHEPARDYVTLVPVTIDKMIVMVPQHHHDPEYWDVTVEIGHESFGDTVWREVRVGEKVPIWRRKRWTGENLEVGE